MEDVRIIERKRSSASVDEVDENISSNNKKNSTHGNTNKVVKGNYKTKVVFTVYDDEKRLLDSVIKNSGISRSDFLMACLQNSQKKSVHKSFAAECARVKKARGIREKELKKSIQAS